MFRLFCWIRICSEHLWNLANVSTVRITASLPLKGKLRNLGARENTWVNFGGHGPLAFQNACPIQVYHWANDTPQLTTSAFQSHVANNFFAFYRCKKKTIARRQRNKHLEFTWLFKETDYVNFVSHPIWKYPTRAKYDELPFGYFCLKYRAQCVDIITGANS